jgi:hypothetical protein
MPNLCGNSSLQLDKDLFVLFGWWIDRLLIYSRTLTATAMTAAEKGSFLSVPVKAIRVTSSLPRVRCSFFDQSCNLLRPRKEDSVIVAPNFRPGGCLSDHHRAGFIALANVLSMICRICWKNGSRHLPNLASKSRVAIVSDFPEAPAVVSLDRNRIAQVFNNVQNVLEAMAEKEELSP